LAASEPPGEIPSGARDLVLNSGTKLGPYDITGAIGKGGMGEVYRAHDSKLGRDVALKVLPEAFARDAERMARFQREAKLLASLSHPNIAAIYGFEDSGSTRALVMEMVEGPTLADRIRTGPIPTDETLRIARQIADALEYAHERGIVHRDLKPANVKVTQDDAVKVLDFGLAKAVEGDASSIDISTSPTITRMATQAGVLLGTAAYMSPEQAKGKPVDRRADIWAFGCVLYEMLTAKHAFGGETVTDTLAAVIRAEPDWSRLRAGTPIRVRVLLQRCLQKDPKQRLRDIGDARISLDEVLSGAPDPALAGAPQAAAPRWRRALPWAVAALLLVTLGPIAYLYFRQSPPPAGRPMRWEIPLPQKTVMGTTGAFALSPDGRQLAFAAAGSDGVNRIWIRPLDSLEAYPLPGTEASSFPPFFWSPDSRFVAFGADGKLNKVEVSSGTVQTICDLPAAVVGGSWNRDGTIIVGQAPGRVTRVPAGGGTPTTVNVEASNMEPAELFPSFLPDGRHFFFASFTYLQSTGSVFVGSLDANHGQTLKSLGTHIESNYVAPSDGSGQVLFVRDGSLVAQPFDTRRLELTGEPVTVAEHVGTFGSYGFFSVSNNGVLVYRSGSQEQSLQLSWFDRQGHALGTVGEPKTFLSAALSPDGTRVAFASLASVKDEPSGLWLLDISRGTSARFTFGHYAGSPVWSPDATRIAFSSRIDDLAVESASGAEDERLLAKSDEALSPTSWSHDGRFLLYTAQPQEASKKTSIWVLPLEGDEKPRTLLRTNFNEQDGHFSPDGHWIAYTSDETGRNEIYVRAFSPSITEAASDAGGARLISSNGGTEPRWRGDGRELFYRAADGKLMAAEVSLAPELRVGIPKALFQMPSEGGPSSGSTWSVTSDGQRFLLPVPRSENTPFTVVLNWQAALKK
jgi:eukaryotic-like serine/threonine-protein kinase